jgi:hypothetical protein
MTAFVSLDGVYQDFGLRASNIHSFPGLAEFDYDISNLERALFKDPKAYARKALITLTCPSAKDPLYQDRYPGCSNVLLLAEADWSWFEKFDSTVKSGSEAREPEYKEFCKFWEEVFLERLYKYYPKAEGKVKSIHIGTPLTNMWYINSPKGASYGLDWDLARFEEDTMQALRCDECKIPNLWTTGTDTLFGGLCGAMMGGVVTFLHLAGFTNFVLGVVAAIGSSWILAFLLQLVKTGLVAAVSAQTSSILFVICGHLAPILIYLPVLKVFPVDMSHVMMPKEPQLKKEQ